MSRSGLLYVGYLFGNLVNKGLKFVFLQAYAFFFKEVGYYFASVFTLFRSEKQTDGGTCCRTTQNS